MNCYFTYNLNISDQTSDNYYKEISKLSHAIFTEFLVKFNDIIEDYFVFQKISSYESVRKKEEYGLELLFIGVLWKSYIKYSKSLKKHHYKIAKIISKKKFSKKYLLNISDDPINFTLEEFDSLIKYLNISKEFAEETKRLEIWKNYFTNLSEDDVTVILQDVYGFACYFTKLCSNELDKYLPCVDEYLKKCFEIHKNKEDIIMCLKPKEQYYINMVGAQVMNDIFYDDFKKTEDKIIILPGCMVIDKTNCKAKHTTLGYVCEECTFNCPVNKINRTLREYNIPILIVHHDSDLYKDIYLDDDKIGVIGVTCVPNLLSGGWKSKRIGFTPQCVLLDYCGCNHWCEKSKVTNLNLNQLINKFEN